jgi:hypothetical protein
LHEQKQAEISKHELWSQKIGFDGTLYIDGKWVKECGEKKLEALFGRELSQKEWNKMQYINLLNEKINRGSEYKLFHDDFIR